MIVPDHDATPVAHHEWRRTAPRRIIGDMVLTSFAMRIPACRYPIVDRKEHFVILGN
jgi:hypothetical protein